MPQPAARIARPTRPACRSTAWYASRRFDRFWLGAFLRYDNLAGAAFEASPLVETAVQRLMENAVEHNDAPDPTVWVDVARDVRDGQRVVSVRIADDGPGIPPEQIDVLERGRETALEHTSGIGLWHANWIIEAAGGELGFEEREPRGSVVEFTVPRADPPEDASGS